MLSKESLKDLLHRDELSRLDRLLLCLAVDAATPKAVKDVTEVAKNAGYRRIASYNVSDILARSSGLAVRTASGWELTKTGCERVATLAGPMLAGPMAAVSTSLRAHLAGIADPEVSAFVEEALRCFENRLYRAAIVFSWVGAASVLQQHVVNSHLAAFNAEAVKRNAKWKNAKTRDDLALMKEFEFLQVLEAISVIGKSTKQELENCLKLRNGCGHPNSFRVAENRASGHIEELILNVFAKFKV